jgi:type IV pilus assembly protein PilV
MSQPIARRSSQEGVLLLEAMVAILIFSIGVLAIVGLQATMVKNTAEAKFRSEASYIAQARIGQMWADPSNLAAYVEADTNIESLGLPSGKRTVTQPSAGEVVVTVTWQQPGPDQPVRTFKTTARITGG